MISKNQFLTKEHLLAKKLNKELNKQLNKDKLLNANQFLNKDQFVNDHYANYGGKEPNDDDQFTTITKESEDIKKSELTQFRDRLSLKLNSITQSSMWSNNITTNKYNQNSFKSNDTSFNSSSLDKTSTRLPSNKPLFNSKSILQKHHSFDHAFNHHPFDRIKMNSSKLNSIKEQQNRSELRESLKTDILNRKKNSCMRTHSQGIIPKARKKSLQITFVIITGK